MSLSAQFKTNKEKVSKGVPFVVGINDDGTRPTFILARTHTANPEYQKVAERIMAPARQVWAITGKVNEAEAEMLGLKVFAEAALIGWENVEWGDVDPSMTPNMSVEGAVHVKYAPYSVENAEKLLKNLPELYEILAGAAADRTRYLESAGDIKN